MPVHKKTLKVKKSLLPGAGKGLFTLKAIPKNTKVIEYIGVITTWKDVKHNDGDNAYIYFLKRSHVIDASRTKSALARYANDARGLARIKGLTNNAEYVEDGLRVYIKTTKDIPAGKEIFVEYGKEYWDVIRHNIKVEAQRKKIREEESLK